MIKPKLIKKIALFTDIHFGRRNNSRVHNQDCLDYIDWFKTQIDKTHTHIAFLGDWYESRSAINIETLDFSYTALSQLNTIGLPVLFCVGNHDLHRRTTRDIHSVRMFNEFSNFTVIEHPTVIDNLLFSPYLFEHEYENLFQYNDLQAFFGHFEFKNFMLNKNRIAESGMDHTFFPGPKKIFSGHYHKRQLKDNVIYIGNTFPADFGDTDDDERGMCTYDVWDDKITFSDWLACPKYRKILFSAINDDWNPPLKARVRCIIDENIPYTLAQDFRETMISTYELRDFMMEENREHQKQLLETGDSEIKSVSIDDLVIQFLETIIPDQRSRIDGQRLISIYKELPIETNE